MFKFINIYIKEVKYLFIFLLCFKVIIHSYIYFPVFVPLFSCFICCIHNKVPTKRTHSCYFYFKCNKTIWCDYCTCVVKYLNLLQQNIKEHKNQKETRKVKFGANVLKSPIKLINEIGAKINKN